MSLTMTMTMTLPLLDVMKEPDGRHDTFRPSFSPKALTCMQQRKLINFELRLAILETRAQRRTLTTVTAPFKACFLQLRSAVGVVTMPALAENNGLPFTKGVHADRALVGVLGVLGIITHLRRVDTSLIFTVFYFHPRR